MQNIKEAFKKAMAGTPAVSVIATDNFDAQVAAYTAELAEARAQAEKLNAILEGMKNTVISKMHKALKESQRLAKKAAKELAESLAVDAAKDTKKQITAALVVAIVEEQLKEAQETSEEASQKLIEANNDLAAQRAAIKELADLKRATKDLMVIDENAVLKSLTECRNKLKKIRAEATESKTKLTNMEVKLHQLTEEICAIQSSGKAAQPEVRAYLKEITDERNQLAKDLEIFKESTYNVLTSEERSMNNAIKSFEAKYASVHGKDLQGAWNKLKATLFTAETNYRESRMKKEDLEHVAYDANKLVVALQKELVDAKAAKATSFKALYNKLTKANDKIKSLDDKITQIHDGVYNSQWDVIYRNPNDFIITKFNHPDLEPEQVEAIINQVKMSFNCPIDFIDEESMKKKGLEGKGRFVYANYNSHPQILIPQPLFWARVLPWYKAQCEAEIAIQEQILSAQGEKALEEYKELKLYINSEWYAKKQARLNELDSLIKEEHKAVKRNSASSEHLKELQDEQKELYASKVYDTNEYAKFIEYRNKAAETSKEVQELNKTYMALGWRRNNFTLYGPTHIGAPNGSEAQATEIIRFLMFNEDVFYLNTSSGKLQLEVKDEFKSVVSQAKRDGWLVEDRVKDAAEEEAERKSDYGLVSKCFFNLFKEVGLLTGEGRTKNVGSEMEEQFPSVRDILIKAAEIAENANGIWNKPGQDYGYTGKINRVLVHLHDQKKAITDSELRMGMHYLDDDKFEDKIFNIRSAKQDLDLGTITDLSGSWYGLNYISHQAVTYDKLTFPCGFNFMVYYDMKPSLYKLKDNNYDAYVDFMLELQKDEGYTTLGDWSALCKQHGVKDTMFYDGFKDHDSISSDAKKICLKLMLNNGVVIGTLMKTGTAKFDLSGCKYPDTEWGELLNGAQEHIRQAYEKAVQKAEEEVLIKAAHEQWKAEKPEACAIDDAEVELQGYYVPKRLMDEYGTYAEAVLAAKAEEIVRAAKRNIAVKNYKETYEFADKLITNTYLIANEVCAQ